ncbi:transglycosylase domain-containing protein [Paucibacter soli]|uniref:transglycosylase domain-containing protein n=1 Tax=Paucibacter soli TaxID=3133433 RepID=UPI0030B5BAB8
MKRRPWIWRVGGVALLATLVACALDELQRSNLQSALWSREAGAAGFRVEPGASPAIRFPSHGPYDERLGYRDLPAHIERLREQGFAVTAQARWSPALLGLGEQGLNVPYREKSQAGLTLADCRGEPLLSLRLPQRQYEGFEAVPELLLRTLLFVEDRHLLDDASPHRNPALDPERFAKAALEQALHAVDARPGAAGGSTLATQLEKYRHSPGGRTGSVSEKLRQMLSASRRAYLDGADTLGRRRQIVLDYLNTVPLAARPGSGEVHGLGDGLWAWYGRDFADFNRALAPDAPLPQRALAYKQALSLMLAQRRPSHYLLQRGATLAPLTDSYLRLLAEAGVIAPALRDAALRQPLALLDAAPPLPRLDFTERKAVSALRVELTQLLNLPSAYALDRLDLAVQTSLDARAQALAVRTLVGLSEPAAARAAGLYGFHLLGERDAPQRLRFSLTLYERGRHANLLRVQADNIDQPFDLNQGARLNLGSTAKLRTLISYLEAVAALHGRWAALTDAELAALRPAAPDELSRWAQQYLLAERAAGAPVGLGAMLDAALQRSFSASPAESFYTGGGLHRFENFEHEHDGQRLSVREAFKHSVNLVFIRLLRELVRHQIYGGPDDNARLLADEADPRRALLLAQFADAEGRVFLQGFYRKYRGRPAAEIEARLQQAHAAAARARGGAAALSLLDRAFLARLHPLELWLLEQLQRRPDAKLAELIAASQAERQLAYAWLFKTRHKSAQDQRLADMLEREAFARIHASWRRLGYPFESLTPSYASAIGASGDRPAALAELMGIILNRGERLAPQAIAALHFGSATPYETRLQRQGRAAEPLLDPLVAAAAAQALLEVVRDGTARRLRGALLDEHGEPLALGGKTGTGDHRLRQLGRGGQLQAERVLGRSASFAFTLGERYFGTVMTYAQEPDAAHYHFTSAISVQLLKSLGPSLLTALRSQACQVE